MRKLRATFNFASSLGTPLQADTIFGHICWALKYIEGEKKLQDFLNKYEESAPLLISDGFPAILDEGQHEYYLPFPSLPIGADQFDALKASLGIEEDNRRLLRNLAAALKRIAKRKYIEEKALFKVIEGLKIDVLLKNLFSLEICPLSMAIKDKNNGCDSWQECPGLIGDGQNDKTCNFKVLKSVSDPTAHNVINRWTNQSENLFVKSDMFFNHGFHFFVSIDESILSYDLLQRCLNYIADSGYGRDATTGKGAICSIKLEDYAFPDVAGADAFINLSSAYVPKENELTDGYYSVHVKRGKLGGDYVLTNSPWKKPVMMIQSGSVFKGDPNKTYGTLIGNVHYELPEVVQYGYAYPLGVKADV